MHKISTDVDKGLCVEKFDNVSYNNTFPMTMTDASVIMTVLVDYGIRLDGIIIEGRVSGKFIPMSINAVSCKDVEEHYRQRLVVTFIMPDEEVLVSLRSRPIIAPIDIISDESELKYREHIIYWHRNEYGRIKIYDNWTDDTRDVTSITQREMNVVPVTIIPNKGYHVVKDSIKITCIETKEEVSIDHLSEYAMYGVRYTSFDFVMPNDNILVLVLFEKDPEPTNEHKLYFNIDRIDGGLTLNSYVICNGGFATMNTGDKGYIKIRYEGNKYPHVFIMGKKTLSKIEIKTLESYSRDNYNRFVCKYYFDMPDEDAILHVKMEDGMMEETKNTEQIDNSSSKYPEGVIDYFDIPDELAKELSDLLTKQVVRERLLLQVVSDPVRYEEMEKMILPITAKIEAIKIKITDEYVPEKYRSTKYMWNYSGYEVDKNKVQILEQK